jgi:hypothetical protein
MEQQKPNVPTTPQLDGPQGHPVGGSLDELNKFVEETSRYEGKTRAVSLILYVAILAVFLIFAWQFYRTIKTNFTQQKFVDSLETRGKEIQPILTQNLLSVINKVMPVYTEEAKKTVQETIPQLKELSQKELQTLLDKTNREIDLLIKEAITTKDDLIKSMYVNLTPQDIDAAKIVNEKAWTDEFTEVTKAIIEPFSADWNKLRNTINKFDNANLPNDDGELFRLMSHYMLLLLDKEIMEVK